MRRDRRAAALHHMAVHHRGHGRLVDFSLFQPALLQPGGILRGFRTTGMRRPGADSGRPGTGLEHRGVRHLRPVGGLRCRPQKQPRAGSRLLRWCAGVVALEIRAPTSPRCTGRGRYGDLRRAAHGLVQAAQEADTPHGSVKVPENNYVLPHQAGGVVHCWGAFW